MSGRGRSIESLSRGRKAVLLAVLCVAVLAVLEGGMRVAYWATGRPVGQEAVPRNYVPFMGYVYKPHAVGDDGYPTDATGFILNDDRERDLRSKTPDEFRVFMFGGSTVAGSGAGSPQKTIPAQLEGMLRSAFARDGVDRRPIVINAGVSGYFSGQEVLMFNYKAYPSASGNAI